MSEDLHAIPMSDLLDEVQRRCPAGAMALFVPQDAGAFDEFFQTWGKSVVVVGMCAMLYETRLQRRVTQMDRAENTPPDEPGDKE